MKQLGLAFTQYTQDYDEKYSEGITTPPSSGTGWAGSIYPYVSSTGVYKCPDDSTSITVDAAAAKNVTYYPVLYSVNSNIVGSGTNGSGQPNASTPGGVAPNIAGALSRINAPANTVLLVEEGTVAPITAPVENQAYQVANNTSPYFNPSGNGFAGTPPVRAFPPNGYGLYDMAGNVWHWCADWYRPDYYAVSPRKNPAAGQRGPTGTGRPKAGAARRLVFVYGPILFAVHAGRTGQGRCADRYIQCRLSLRGVCHRRAACTFRPVKKLRRKKDTVNS